jgi:hypothetical protein
MCHRARHVGRVRVGRSKPVGECLIALLLLGRINGRRTRQPAIAIHIQTAIPGRREVDLKAYFRRYQANETAVCRDGLGRWDEVCRDDGVSIVTRRAQRFTSLARGERCVRIRNVGLAKGREGVGMDRRRRA